MMGATENVEFPARAASAYRSARQRAALASVQEQKDANLDVWASQWPRRDKDKLRVESNLFVDQGQVLEGDGGVSGGRKTEVVLCYGTLILVLEEQL